MNDNPYDPWKRTLFELWELGRSHKQRGMRYKPPLYSGANQQAIIAYIRGWDSI